MIPEGFKAFGGGGETTLHPLGLMILIAGILAIWFIPKRYMLVPFVMVSLLVPASEQMVIVGLHFSSVRILILAAWLRLAVGFKQHKMTALDKVLIVWLLAGTIAYTLLWGAFGALIFKLGHVYTGLGIYFLFRQCVSDRATAIRLVHVLAVVSVIIASLMLVESLTGVSALATVGGPEQVELRNGRFRAQGPFVHSIIAGTFGAMLMPMLAGLWSIRESRKYAVAGVLGTTVVVLTSASSTPIAAYLAGVVALCIWPVRQHMRLVRWGIASVLVGLHIVMKAPVWALVARFDVIGGSSGWHRFLLIDQFIRHVGDWWLTGTTTNASWGWDMWDKANWYVASGITGGMATFLLFIAVIVVAFQAVGRGRAASKGDRNTEHFVWGLGSSLLAAAIAFCGINLIDQSIVVWFALLALVAAASNGALQVSSVESARLKKLRITDLSAETTRRDGEGNTAVASRRTRLDKPVPAIFTH